LTGTAVVDTMPAGSPVNLFLSGLTPLIIVIENNLPSFCQQAHR
jgi:hypothetical protein